MLTWIGGGFLATVIAFLLLTTFIGNLRVDTAFERTLRPDGAATRPSRDEHPTKG